MVSHSKNTSPRADAQKNRIKIKQSAITIFKNKGLEATIEEIADHANVGVGTIYRNFGSKQELANLISYEVLNEIYKKQIEVIESDFPIEEKLYKIFDTFIYLSTEYGEIHQMVLQLLTSTIEPNPLKEDWQQKLHSLYHRLVALGQKEGIFSKENTLIQEKILINTVNPMMVKEVSAILPIEEAAVTLSKFVLNGLIIRK
ncbi:TetR/AcrR family transcriptional regulator [Lysinibacillus endophyticus]|uniref:TetR/AcrR family transcriptional regulator n=1 Tax=Ureibacillus endophyticus TaxID=1978490 RepID=UPI00209EEF50|nr:TetR/AcrR family transcriptional regulator [Lysinibacillus endophyticus]MCP1145516.1 TetR/AcrR family transcriptional regulator [Lysinibacillus endophyticus]